MIVDNVVDVADSIQISGTTTVKTKTSLPQPSPTSSPPLPKKKIEFNKGSEAMKSKPLICRKITSYLSRKGKEKNKRIFFLQKIDLLSFNSLKK